MLKTALTALLLALVGTQAMKAQEAYVVYQETATDTIMTFYYDNAKSEKTDKVFNITNKTYPEWYSDGSNAKVTKVVFDPSFADARPTYCENWFQAMARLTSIEGIENLNTERVTSMWRMFEGCSSLTSLDVSHFDTRNVKSMAFMFYDCTSLTSLDVSHFDTSNVTDMRNIFCGCSSLTSLDVTNFDTSNVTTMSYMFAHCPGLTTLDVTHFDTRNVKSMLAMFLYCSGLTTLDVTHFDTRNVTDMGLMFQGCSSLTSLDVRNFDTSNVKAMTSMFRDCSSLTSLNVRNFDTRNVVAMSMMFYNCSKLYFLDLSSFDTGNVTTMWAMFDDCSMLWTIDLSNSDTSNVTDMENMFDGCGGLTTLDLSTFDTHKVQKMGHMFWGCDDLTTITVSDLWTTAAVTSSDYMFFNDVKLVGGAGTKYSSNHYDAEYARIDGIDGKPGYLTGVDVEPLSYANLANGRLTFYFDRKHHSRYGLNMPLNKGTNRPFWAEKAVEVTDVVFDVSFDKYLPPTTIGWFSDMTNLKSITHIDYLHTDTVTNMRAMFFNCSSLESVDLSTLNTERVTNMRDMFSGCTAMKTIDLSNFDTRQVTNMMQMFGYCPNLTRINAGDNWSTDNVELGMLMFVGCEKLHGGKGTRYSPDHVDSDYARIDGGPDAPGYLSRITDVIVGDVNDDGEVGIGDIVAITNVMAGITTDADIVARADVNGDDDIGIGDIVAITNIMAGVNN